MIFSGTASCCPKLRSSIKLKKKKAARSFYLGVSGFCRRCLVFRSSGLRRGRCSDARIFRKSDFELSVSNLFFECDQKMSNIFSCQKKINIRGLRFQNASSEEIFFVEAEHRFVCLLGRVSLARLPWVPWAVVLSFCCFESAVETASAHGDSGANAGTLGVLTSCSRAGMGLRIARIQSKALTMTFVWTDFGRWGWEGINNLVSLGFETL